MQDLDNLQCLIATTLLKGIGIKKSKDLIAYCGGAKAIFNAKKKELLNIPGIGKKGLSIFSESNKKEALLLAEQHLNYMQENNIQVFNYLDAAYPRRLKHCIDAPILLYGKGNLDFDYPKTLAIVGTRRSTDYGQGIVDELIAKFSEMNVQVISGLAYGTDIYAHRSCLKNQVSTVGVLAHGLDRLYPAIHRKTANQMMDNGGLITEFLPGTNPDRENFPTRNRIVAGMCDATIVVESGDKGGSLITAYMANDYNRDVFAFPGDVNRVYSKGCNYIIKKQKAHLATSAEDIIYMMNWEEKEAKGVQTEMFVDFEESELEIVELLRSKNDQSIDELAYNLNKPVSELSSTLLTMEFSGYVRSLPGKRYLLMV